MCFFRISRGQLTYALCRFTFGLVAVIAAVSAAAADDLRYFVVEGTLSAAVAEKMVDEPGDVMAGARALVDSIEGAKLVGYYLLAGKPQNLAIIAVPDSDYAAAITYQRMGTGALQSIEVYEVIPGENFERVLELANDLDVVRE